MMAVFLYLLFFKFFIGLKYNTIESEPVDLKHQRYRHHKQKFVMSAWRYEISHPLEQSHDDPFDELFEYGIHVRRSKNNVR